MMVDNYFYFDKSTKRKSGLSEYCTFCDTDYCKILKHVSTRWLSLEKEVDRTLKQFMGLRSYFLSESKLFAFSKFTIASVASFLAGTDARFERLQRLYTDPMSEVYLFFYQSALQLFVRLNLFLQKDDPIIPAVSGQLWQFLKNLLGRIVTIAAIIDSQADISSVQYKDQQLSGKCPDIELAQINFLFL